MNLFQSPVLPDLLQESIYFLLQFRDLGHRGNGDGRRISLPDIVLQDPDSFKTVPDSCLQGYPPVHESVQLSLAYGSKGRYITAEVFDLCFWKKTLYQLIIRRARCHADLSSFFFQLLQRCDRTFLLLPAAACCQSQYYTKDQQKAYLPSHIRLSPYLHPV